MARARGCVVWALIAASLVVCVAGVLAYRAYRAASALADATSVLFDTECTSKTGPCAGAPRLKIVVDGKDETAQGDLRALSHGSHVVFTVEPTVDGVASLQCRIVLVGYQRTLATNTGPSSARCEATIP